MRSASMKQVPPLVLILYNARYSVTTEVAIDANPARTCATQCDAKTSSRQR